MIKEEIANKIIQFVVNNRMREEDKWEAGKKNEYYAWDDAFDEIYDFLKGVKK